MKMTKIYDTSSLLIKGEDIFDNAEENKIIITNITLKELEQIKTSPYKDTSIKYMARRLLHLLDNNPDKYECIMYKQSYEKYIVQFDTELNNDSKILITAYQYCKSNDLENYYFITNDLALKKIAELLLGAEHVLTEQIEDNYTGYKEIYLDNEEMAEFYSDQTLYGNKLKLKINEYLNIYEKDSKQRVDTLCWTSEGFRQLKYKSFYSKQVGEIKPYKNDIYQAMTADSLLNNQITMIKGPAGTGKSHLAIGYLFYLLEKGRIDKIIIFCNTVATKNAAKLGFYPGSKDEKLLDSQIGNFLASKLGSKLIVEQLINDEKLILLPMSDIRGYDTSGMHAGIYITEAQNLDIELLKLALQRSGEDTIFILDGDTKSQVDLIDYEGANNGMYRASKVFRGEDIYGEIELKQIHRSKIAQIANRM